MNIKSEKAAAMLEAAILLPFLLFTALACWDSGNLLNAHAVLLQNTDDLAQWASSDPNLEIGAYQVRYTGNTQPADPLPPLPPLPTNTDLCPTAIGYECEECTGPSCAGSCGGAAAAMSNLCATVTKMESSGVDQIVGGSVKARLDFDKPVDAPDRVEVIVSARFDGLFLFRNITIISRKLLPYLGPRQ